MENQNNLEYWNSWKEVPENAMRPFNNGRFKGTDINTMWRLKCLTEKFGPCGIGWYYMPKRMWIEQTANGEQFAFAEIELYIKVDGEWSKPISGNGGNKLTRLNKDGEISTSDEAYKMAVTDAIGVACRNLGIGADVYWENDTTKYSESNQIDTRQRRLDEALFMAGKTISDAEEWLSVRTVGKQKDYKKVNQQIFEELIARLQECGAKLRNEKQAREQNKVNEKFNNSQSIKTHSFGETDDNASKD